MTVHRSHDMAITAERFNDASDGNHHGWLGFVVTEAERGRIEATMTIRADHLNPGGSLHGGVAASLADSLCGYGAFTALPDGATGFTTVALDASYVGRANLGDTVTAVADLARGGRRIQVWNVSIMCDDSLVALARITQLMLYPRS
jgi:1,4-dihydroxy-2-naphthoyl-CoA hydrolase